MPASTNRIAVSGGGPGGLVLRGNRLYVYTRFHNGISTINTTTQSEIAHATMFNPEPANVVNGRPVLYDATTTSSNGEASCSSCHVFGDFDSLAWDLGNPNDSETTSPLTQKINPSLTGTDPDFFPMKGPMTTQSLRGLDNHGAMHWRVTVGRRVRHRRPDDSSPSTTSSSRSLACSAGTADHAHPNAAVHHSILDVTYPPIPIRSTMRCPSEVRQPREKSFNGATTDTLQLQWLPHAQSGAGLRHGRFGHVRRRDAVLQNAPAQLYQKIACSACRPSPASPPRARHANPQVRLSLLMTAPSLRFTAFTAATCSVRTIRRSAISSSSCWYIRPRSPRSWASRSRSPRPMRQRSVLASRC